MEGHADRQHCLNTFYEAIVHIVPFIASGEDLFALLSGGHFGLTLHLLLFFRAVSGTHRIGHPKPRRIHLQHRIALRIVLRDKARSERNGPQSRAVRE